jgi:sulfur-oxidizing protein SoxX
MTLRTILAGSALVVALSPTVQAQSLDADVLGIMKSSFKERGIAKLDRLDQNDLQKQCSEYSTRPMPAPMKAALEKAALDAVKYPADGNFLGDWKQGERVAQSGVGLQFSDNDKTVNGGNCYACHQISKEEISYGNIGPTLYQYGKLRGNTVEIQRYTWARIWNAHAFNACNIMPRFGAAGILTEEQIRHVMALLLDPTSPVNR